MITPEALDACRRGGDPIELIDVRTRVEYREIHAATARLVPLRTLDPAAVMATRVGSMKDPFYVICGSGGRSRRAVEAFRASGFPEAVSVAGGMIAWERAGLPVIRGAAVMSLERQVRIAAGSLIVIGTALGTFIHPAFYGLSAFVGAGLVFAGLSDTCGMGMLLARMPWNRSEASDDVGRA